jgi:hypothetical protein
MRYDGAVTHRRMVLLSVSLLGAMVAVGVTVGWRVMQRAFGVEGTDAPVAFAVHDGAIYVLRGGGGEVELVRAPLEGEPEVLWRGPGEQGGFVAAGAEGVLFSVCTEPEEVPWGCAAKSFFSQADGALRQLSLTRLVTSAAFLEGRIFLIAGGAIHELAPSGGALRVVTYSTACSRRATHLVAGDDAVHWSDGATIWSLTAEGEFHELRGGVAWVEALAVAGGEIYVLEPRARHGDPVSGRVVKIARTTAGTRLYDPAIGIITRATAAPTVVIDGLRDPTDMVITDDAIVVTAEEPDGKGVTHRALFVAPRAGGLAERWRALPPRGGAIASDGRRLFVAGGRVAALDLP